MLLRITCAIAFSASLLGSVFAQEQELPKREPRVFAPGVETVIEPTLEPGETTSIHEMVEFRTRDELKWNPRMLTPTRTLHNLAEEARFERELWCLEFAFKPLRMIRLESASVEEDPRLVWYLVYRVKNSGEMLSPTKSDEDGGFTAERVPSKPIRFSPHLLLQGHDVGPQRWQALPFLPRPRSTWCGRANPTP